MYPAKSDTSFKTLLKMFVYIFIASFVTIFVHDGVLAHNLRNTERSIQDRQLIKNININQDPDDYDFNTSGNNNNNVNDATNNNNNMVGANNMVTGSGQPTSSTTSVASQASQINSSQSNSSQSSAVPKTLDELSKKLGGNPISDKIEMKTNAVLGGNESRAPPNKANAFKEHLDTITSI
jgi:hypothetical protein